LERTVTRFANILETVGNTPVAITGAKGVRIDELFVSPPQSIGPTPKAPASGALNAAAIAAAAPQPTKVRKSLRRKCSSRPMREAVPEPSWVKAASNPTEAPTPAERTVSAVRRTLSLNDMRPPCSALASTGSTSVPRLRAI